jgi:hypothetical protein
LIAENEKSPASVNLQGFSVRLTSSLSPVEKPGFLTGVELKR